MSSSPGNFCGEYGGQPRYFGVKMSSLFKLDCVMMIGPLLLPLPIPNPLLLLLQFVFPPPITMSFIILIDMLFVLREEPRDSCPISQYVFKSTSCMPLYHLVVISSARLRWRDIITGDLVPGW